MRSRSPTTRCFARLARAPPTSTLPPPTAAAASARVLKKRAAHNHRSSRTCDPSDMAPLLLGGYGPRAEPDMRIMGTAAPPKPFFVQSPMHARFATRSPVVSRRSVAASRALRPVTLGIATSALLLGCGTPGVRGVAGTAPAPNVLWTPPRPPPPPPPGQPAAAHAALPPELPPDLAARIAQLRLTDVIDIALRNNTATSAAWADARAAAATYGAAKGQYYPTIALNGAVTAIRRTVSQAGQQAVEQQFYAPTLNLSWLLLDFGGRSGSVGAARAALLAADWTHNATLPLGVIEGVDTLIAQALRERPDLGSQRALVEQARARVSVARSQALPTLAVGGNAGETYFISQPPPGSAKTGNSYNATLTLSIPLFSGGTQIYTVKAASAAAEAAARRAHGFEQQVVYQVFNAFYGLRTATQQVRTSRDLLASATESEQVALGRYKAGAGSLLDLLTAQAALATARAQTIQARLSWNTALAQLAHDVGIL